MTDPQTIFNVLASLIAFLGVWILTGIKESIKALHTSDAELSSKTQDIEVLVAGNYVRRDDLERLSVALFNKLDRIEIKMDNKADKEWCAQVHGTLKT